MNRFMLTLLALSCVTAAPQIDAGKNNEPIVSQDSYYKKGHTFVTEFLHNQFTPAYDENKSEQFSQELATLLQDVRSYPATSKSGLIAFKNMKNYCKGAADALRALNVSQYQRLKGISYSKENEQFFVALHTIVRKSLDTVAQAPHSEALSESLIEFLQRDGLTFMKNVKAPAEVKKNNLILSAADKQTAAYLTGKEEGAALISSLENAIQTGSKIEFTADSVKNSSLGKKYLQITQKLFSTSPKTSEHKAAFKEFKLMLSGIKDGMPFSSVKPHLQRLNQINPFMGPIAIKTYIVLMDGIDYLIAADDINNGSYDCFRFWLSELNLFIIKYQSLLNL